MAPKKVASKATDKIIKCFAHTDARAWYMDFYKEEKKLFRPHLFVAEANNVSKFQDIGQVKDITTDKVLSDDGVELHECIEVIVGNVNYQVLADSFESTRVCHTDMDNMYGRGLLKSESFKHHELYESLKESLSFKKRAKRKIDLSKCIETSEASVSRKASQTTIGANTPSTTPNLLAYSEKTPSSTNEMELVVGDPDLPIKELDMKKLESKKEKQAIGGLDEYEEYFSFGFGSYQIPVKNCRPPPSTYCSRSLENSKVEEYVKSFITNPMPCSSCAYLVPVKIDRRLKSFVPMNKEELEEDNLLEYRYWSIDGQHSIQAARTLLEIQISDISNKEKLHGYYSRRDARIVVNPPPHVAVAISAIANTETQNIMIHQPYPHVLKHLHNQWIFYGRPARPSIGVNKGVESRKEWDAFLFSAQSSVGLRFLKDYAHMVVVEDDVFQRWQHIMALQSQKKLPGRSPSASTFRCLAGLDIQQIREIQEDVLHEVIVLQRSQKDEHMIDLTDRVKSMKYEKVVHASLLDVFNDLSAKHCSSWNELVEAYDLKEHVIEEVKRKCTTWLQAKLQRGKLMKEFPDQAKHYLLWIINLSYVERLPEELPWDVRVASIAMESKDFLLRHGDAVSSFQLCIIDLIEKFEMKELRDVNWFCNFFQGVLTLVSETIILIIVDYENFKVVQHALDQSLCWKKSFFGVLKTLEDAPCEGASEIISMLIFIGKEKFSGYERLCALNYKPNLNRITKEEDIRTSKKNLVRECICTFCNEHDTVLDVYSNGSISKVALQHKRRVVCLVNDPTKHKKIHDELLEWAKQDRDVREWAGLQVEVMQETKHQSSNDKCIIGESDSNNIQDGTIDSEFDTQGAVKRLCQLDADELNL